MEDETSSFDLENVKTAMKSVERHIREVVREDLPEDFKILLVSFTYILGEWKAVLTTNLQDGMLYEVTYNRSSPGPYNEIYVNSYKKSHGSTLTV